MTATMLGLGGLGWFVDRRLGSAPIGLILGIFAGFAYGLRNLLNDQSRSTNTDDDVPPTNPED